MFRDDDGAGVNISTLELAWKAVQDVARLQTKLRIKSKGVTFVEAWVHVYD